MINIEAALSLNRGCRPIATVKFAIFPLAIANAATLAIIMSSFDVGLVAWFTYAVMLPVYFFGVRALQDRCFKT